MFLDEGGDKGLNHWELTNSWLDQNLERPILAPALLTVNWSLDMSSTLAV